MSLSDYNKSYWALLFDEEEEYEELIRNLNDTFPKSTHTYNNLAIAYMEMGMDDMVLPSFAKAIELDPQNDMAYFNTARFLHCLGRKDFALAEWNYTQAIRIAPTNPAYYTERAEMYMQQYEKEAFAYSDYKRSFELNPKNEFVLNKIRMLETTLSIKNEDRVVVKISWKDRFMAWIKGKK